MHENWHILVVEDDKDIHRLLNDNLQMAGLEVSSVYDARSALELIEREGLPHLAIVDIRLPDKDMDGLDLAEELTQRSVPVIIITAYDSPKTVLDSLRFADDYVRKPFEPDEVTSRVRRVLSRIGDFSYAKSPMLDVDERVQFDYTNNNLVIDDERVNLTPIESRLLHTLMQHRGNVVDGRALIARVWSSDNIYEDTLRVHIHRLRSKLEVDPRHPKYILTERGIGYSFAA
jgi:DNA-binding response OmpR family regulator